MGIYVDSLRDYGWILRGRSVKSCHLLADTEDELDRFAASIGLKIRWKMRGSIVHYDLVASMRRKAVESGAEEVDGRRLLGILRRIRKSNKEEQIK